MSMVAVKAPHEHAKDQTTITMETADHESSAVDDLREVFALHPKQKEQKAILFPKLRRIHLYELPSLRRICGSRMSAPNLETVKIRGCWSLRCLPAVSGNNEKLPSVDCEKEWALMLFHNEQST
ncbi:hypothetical protein TRIUR3_11194 [Triticum urartu]|uniref:Uncharacterized protein n=1 Tax=Triticum urartu TaxID=4572 RepID=M8ACC7_TRIUA|nr:hypothetical protein TRIUR3_11194 [Triticum urartu]